MARGDIVTDPIEPGTHVDVTRQGNLELYSDVRRISPLPLSRRIFPSLRVCVRPQDALRARQSLMNNPSVLNAVKKVHRGRGGKESLVLVLITFSVCAAL